jgi:hypothetical protein
MFHAVTSLLFQFQRISFPILANFSHPVKSLPLKRGETAEDSTPPAGKNPDFQAFQGDGFCGMV